MSTYTSAVVGATVTFVLVYAVCRLLGVQHRLGGALAVALFMFIWVVTWE